MANILWTKDSLASIQRLNVAKDTIYHVVHDYDKKFPGKQPGTTLFTKDTGSGYISVIAKHTQSGDILILAFWVKKSHSHNKSSYDSRYKNASFWKRVWLDLLTTFGL